MLFSSYFLCLFCMDKQSNMDKQSKRLLSCDVLGDTMYKRMCL